MKPACTHCDGSHGAGGHGRGGRAAGCRIARAGNGATEDLRLRPERAAAARDRAVRRAVCDRCGAEGRSGRSAGRRPGRAEDQLCRQGLHLPATAGRGQRGPGAAVGEDARRPADGRDRPLHAGSHPRRGVAGGPARGTGAVQGHAPGRARSTRWASAATRSRPASWPGCWAARILWLPRLPPKRWERSARPQAAAALAKAEVPAKAARRTAQRPAPVRRTPRRGGQHRRRRGDLSAGLVFQPACTLAAGGPERPCQGGPRTRPRRWSWKRWPRTTRSCRPRPCASVPSCRGRRSPPRWSSGSKSSMRRARSCSWACWPSAATVRRPRP